MIPSLGRPARHRHPQPRAEGAANRGLDMAAPWPQESAPHRTGANMVERRWEEIAGLSAMEGWRLPVLTYRGTSGEPGAYLQAALHADEPPGVAVIHALAADLERAEAEGRLCHNVTIVPYANPIGLS